jgi:4-hydroxy-tetrahydrodipicolinate synthase
MSPSSESAGAKAPLSGVFPVLPTPFREDLRADVADLARLVEFAVESGVDGVVYPGVASEYDTLAFDERKLLVDEVARVNDRRVAFVVGVSSTDASAAATLARHAAELGADAVMAMAPAQCREDEALVDFFGGVAAAGLPVILQNASPPLGAALAPTRVAALVRAVAGIAYVKEEVLPCGQRISALLALGPTGLLGVFGGAGGRYVTDELARGACGTMPAAELADVHVQQFALHRAGDAAGVRLLFNRMLPLLNFQAVFRMAMTKEVLRRRGVIRSTHVRAAGPALDEGDLRELDALLAEIDDLIAKR